MKRRLPSWLLVVLLGTPLLGLTVWVAHGAATGSHGRAAATVPPSTVRSSGLPAPSADLPAERLDERLDGAADALRADGCRRLVAWRFEQPPANAEALFFGTVAGARAVLEREAGTERTPGPGDEAQVSRQAVYFRRGTVLVRVFLDPGASPPPGELLARAGDVDRVLREGGLS
jgi:hypothetical protein